MKRSNMQIHDNIKIVGHSLYLEEYKTLIIADLHLGYEQELIKKGVLVPKKQFERIIKQLDKIFEEVEAEQIILNGDVKHAFGKISEQEWRDILRLIDYLKRKVKKIIVVEGNHDPVLWPVTAKRNIELVHEVQFENILVTHGDEDINPKEYNIDTIIMGHEHPAIQLAEGARKERFKCFMKGKYKKATLLCLPSFNPLTEGTDMLSEPRLSPLLQDNIENFEVWTAVGARYFGKIKDLEH